MLMVYETMLQDPLRHLRTSADHPAPPAPDQHPPALRPLAAIGVAPTPSWLEAMKPLAK